jgi:hypothetical protein
LTGVTRPKTLSLAQFNFPGGVYKLAAVLYGQSTLASPRDNRQIKRTTPTDCEMIAERGNR